MIENSIGSAVLQASPIRRRGCDARTLAAPTRQLRTAGPTAGCLLAGHTAATIHLASNGAAVITTVAVVFVGVVAATASFVDLVDHRIPNRHVGAMAAVVGLTVIAEPRPIVPVLMGALLGGLPLLWVRLSRGIGMGDVKFAVALGATGGLAHPLVGVVTVFVASATSGMWALVTRRRRMPLAPWLWGGFAVALVATPAIGAGLARIGGLR